MARSRGRGTLRPRQGCRQVVTDCPRNFTKEELISGLRAGRTLVVDRRDAPELPDLLELEAQGLVVSELVVYDEQSSAMKFRWKAAPE